MKKILITGANSYVGTSFEKWVAQWPDKYSVDIVNMIDGTWKDKKFSEYDVVFHVAGIAHIKETKKNASLYFKVNRDLTNEVAQKARTEGIKQFIFMSSMSVYGINSGVIDKGSVPNPTSNYGKSKLQAEAMISQLMDDAFKIVILRPPMIYGKGSKGNYSKLSNYSKKLPIFPNVKNQRSMIHIDNLCEFLRLVIDNEEQGLFFPQNSEYVTTAEMVRLIVEANGKRIILTNIFNPLLNFLNKYVNIINKVFGSLVYEKSISDYKENYRIRDFKNSINVTER
jgi:UDP-glucose 4-epimerase